MMSANQHDFDAGSPALAAAVSGGDVRAASRLLSRIERGDPAIESSLAALHAQGGRTPVFGITGPPGAGKSSLVDQLIVHLRARRRRVAVLAVDPSSPFTGGAILGDRVRMGQHNVDTGVFIRSMAARGSLGGLARAAGDALIVLDAMGWDAILVETVGVGQSEIDILRHADTVLVLQTPLSGDTMQAVKAGLLEVGDIFVVNKADAPGADRATAVLREAIDFRAMDLPPQAWRPRLLQTKAVEGEGVAAVLQAMDLHRAHLVDHPEQAMQRRRTQVRAQLVERVAEILRGGALVDEAPGLQCLLDEVVARRCDPMTAVRRLLAMAWEHQA
ncbi:LAO/AO transport system kinase [Variovorax sp. HW608]|uniref:methylmalonyl Co-A mutase-associated GTPase MeaB n=1 Tax=Variovorax sp. HW608 TaxID=1034889 RepID=UPI00081FC090|nr:methylmalonyl Co-A mutase-associated GTPase MeaB [Variovorax sp. HW608]SCK10794.1 LAO/AO transport system kinase [Variovorax sp. HW608]